MTPLSSLVHSSGQHNYTTIYLVLRASLPVANIVYELLQYIGVMQQRYSSAHVQKGSQVRPGRLARHSGGSAMYPGPGRPRKKGPGIYCLRMRVTKSWTTMLHPYNHDVKIVYYRYVAHATFLNNDGVRRLSALL